MGSSMVAGAHGIQHAKRKAMYKVFKPFVSRMGPDASRLFSKHFKPRFLKPALFKGMAAGGLMGAAPGAVIAALT